VVEDEQAVVRVMELELLSAASFNFFLLDSDWRPVTVSFPTSKFPTELEEVVEDEQAVVRVMELELLSAAGFNFLFLDTNWRPVTVPFPTSKFRTTGTFRKVDRSA
jgi:2-keto-3-deoxy-L-rhamnonate aldolase RhmA